MPIKTTKLKDILTREQVYPETNVASIVDFDENIAVNAQTVLGNPYLSSLTFKGVTYRVAGDASAALAEEIARAEAKEQELLEYITYLLGKFDEAPGASLVALDSEGNTDEIHAVNDDTGNVETLIVKYNN